MKLSNLHTKMTKGLLGVMILSSSLLAAEISDQEGIERIPVGNRQMSHVETVKIQEQRAALFQKFEQGEAFAEDENIELSDAEKQEIGSQGEEIAATEEGKEQSGKEASKLIQKGINSTTYYTSHQGAFHRPVGVSFLGDAVELEDGSIWSVYSGDRFLTLDWLTSDLILVVPNHDWFSVYNYRLINANTGANVKVNLTLGPIYNGIFTHWILAIDYYHREICLEDGSVWKMSSLESSVLNTWLHNDTIIIGINDGWFSGSNPNILINVNMNNYSMGSCIY